jgi:hypothetical protein
MARNEQRMDLVALLEAAEKVKITELTQNLQVDPAV